jgi:F0F1-type ATP synthase membrane subunit b/b'
VKFQDLNNIISTTNDDCFSELNFKKEDFETDLRVNVKNLQKKYKKLLNEDKKKKVENKLYEAFIKDLKRIS